MKTIEKLESKHLIPYLSVGLKYLRTPFEPMSVQTMIGLYYEHKQGLWIVQNQPSIWIKEYAEIKTNESVTDRVKNLVIQQMNEHLFQGDIISNVKPILHPLSEYKDCDEVFDEMSEYSEELFIDLFLGAITPLNKFDHINVSVYNALLKNHFDVFGLIESGLAIDINTI